MSATPLPFTPSNLAHPPRELTPSRSAEERSRATELREHAKTLSETKEKLEEYFKVVKSAQTSFQARALAAARAGLIKGEELQHTTATLLKSKALIERLEKYFHGWTYADLAYASFFADKKEERERARVSLGYTIVKDTTAEVVHLAREVGLLSESISAKEFLIKILGKGAVLGLEGLELPATIVFTALEPSQTAKDDDTIKPNDYVTAKQAECLGLIQGGAAHHKISRCMADVLMLRRGIAPEHPRYRIKNTNRPTHTTSTFAPSSRLP